MYFFSGVATFITGLGSPMTPDSRASEYSIPSPDVCEPIMAPPPSLQSSTDEIDLTCWPWGEEWTADCSNIELFSDTSDTTDYCKADSNISSIELDKNITEDDSCNNLNIFENSSKINDLFNSLPLSQCKLIESSDMKSECNFNPTKKLTVSNKQLPIKCTQCSSDENFSRDIINSLQSDILDDKSLLKDESLLPLQFSSCDKLLCANKFDKVEFQLCEDHTNKSILNQIKKDKVKELKKTKVISSSISENLKLKNIPDDNKNEGKDQQKKKLCTDKTTMLPNKGRYFMRSSSGSSRDFQTKISHLLDQNKNVQGLSSTKLKFSSQNSITKHYQCDNTSSIRNNEQLNFSTTKVASVNGFNSNKIRFPKLDSHWISLSGNIICRWDGCNNHFTASAKLIEHLQVCKQFIFYLNVLK